MDNLYYLVLMMIYTKDQNMQNHTKVYYNFFELIESDFVACSNCGACAVDIHHIERRNKTKNDFIENLVPLCRSCHSKCDNPIFNQTVRIKHLIDIIQKIEKNIDFERQYNEVIT
jgi:5-methylcytosine-specific restriction endonuclease McrA